MSTENPYHVPVLLKECIEGLNIRPNGTYVDVTYGGGGHSKEILAHLKNGRLIGFDQDEDAEKRVIDDQRLIFIRGNFSYLKNYLRYINIDKVDGILGDLGVSSHHFDEKDRGFSFRFDGELDMRMNQSSDFNAQVLLNTYSRENLYRIFKQFGEIQNTGKLVQNIEKYRSNAKIRTINEFLEAIKECIPKFHDNKYLAQVFQALRMEVNHEIESLKAFLIKTPDVLKSNGRLVVITYHSLEDRLVKNFMRSGKFEGEPEKDFYGNLLAPFEQVNKKVIVPEEEEIKQNNRARSAKLRIARKI